MDPDFQPGQPALHEGYVPVENAELYYREIGQGRPIIILHGGPDFDHSYFLPDMDRLAGSFHLIYYDQRGRGRSAGDVRPEDVSIESEVEDLDRIRQHLQLESAAVLGHSWGGLLAMLYAIRHPERVSHLILMNTAPASRQDYLRFRQERARNAPDDVKTLLTLASGAAHKEGDPEADLEYYRVHFRATLRQPEHLDRLLNSLRLNFTRESILKARRIEERLMNETWLSDGYDLLPELRRLSVPTLVIHGDYDFVPLECATHIAEAIPDARFVLLPECGHFAYMEHPDEIRKEIADLLKSN